MKKGIWILIMISSQLLGQTYTSELLNYSITDIGGTARSIGAGGAFSSVGADMGSAMTNPAGQGLYRSSEVALSLGLSGQNSKTSFFNTAGNRRNTNFSVPHAGAVFAIPIKRAGKPIRFFQVGIVFQRMANFNRERIYDGQNDFNSKIDVYYDEIINSNNPIQYQFFTPGAVQAWNTYLVDSFNGQYFKRVFAPVNQSGTIRETGSANEVAFNFSGNVNDKIYIGAGLGLPFLNYTRVNSHSESIDYNDSIYGFQRFDQVETYDVKGLGANFKFGIIARPFDFWRIGASITTPSLFFNLEETTTAQIQSNLTDGVQDYTFTSDTFLSAPFQFRYNRPLNATFGTSFIISKWGFVSVDYELTDYKNTRLGFDASAQAAEDDYNSEIRALYGIGHKIKIGGEFAWKVLRVRAGYNWVSTPFRNGIGVKGYDQQSNIITAGLGYRGKRFYVDMAYAHFRTSDYLSLYRATTNEPGLRTNTIRNSVILTAGFRFGGVR